MKGWFYITERRTGKRHLFYAESQDRVYRPEFDQVVLNNRGRRDVSKSIKLVPVSMAALHRMQGIEERRRSVGRRAD